MIVRVMKVERMLMFMNQLRVCVIMAMLESNRRILRMGVMPVVMVMAVLVYQYIMFVPMLVPVKRGEIRSGNHYRNSYSKRRRGCFTKDNKRQTNADERSDSVKRACPRSSEASLGKDIEVDT